MVHETIEKKALFYLSVQNVREMHYLFNVYNRLFQSAILLYMYHLLTFDKEMIFFSVPVRL